MTAPDTARIGRRDTCSGRGDREWIADADGPVEHRDHTEYPVLRVDDRYRQQRVRHVPDAFGDIAGESRVGMHLVDHERLARLRDVAGDSLGGRQAQTHHVLGAGSFGRLVREFVVVEPCDRHACRPDRESGQRAEVDELVALLDGHQHRTERVGHRCELAREISGICHDDSVVH